MTMDSDLTDEELMRRVARDDPAAFDLLFLRYWRAVFNYTGRMVGDREAAEDLTQECFLRVWRARQSYRPSAAFRTWLFTIGRRLALNELRKRQTHRTVLIAEIDGENSWSAYSAGGASAEAGSPQEIVLRQELARLVESAIESLPAELREVVILRETEEMSYEEIAGIVGCPLGTVKSRLSAARQRLRAAALEWMGEKQT